MFKAVLAIGAGVAALLLVAASGSAAPPAPNVTCSQVTQSFSGTARDLIVPANGYCAIDNATITHDLIVQYNAGGDVTNSTIGHDARYADDAGGDFTNSTIQHDARYANEGGGSFSGSTVGHDLSYSEHSGGAIDQSTIGHDVTAGADSGLFLTASQVGHNLVARQPQTVQTGCSDPTADCHVRVGNDFVIDGSPGPPDPDAFVFDGMCDLGVGHDLRITNRWVTLGLGLGDGCGGTGSGPISVGHNLVFSGNTALTGFFGPSALDVVNARVGHDLTVTRNSAADHVKVADNTIANAATCRDNNPPASLAGGAPNTVGGTNNGCP